MSLFDLEVLDEIIEISEPTATAVVADGTRACSFCEAPVFLDGTTEHPCCTFARAAGHIRCEGCTNFAHRQSEG